jgi:hypothetical protein
MEKLHDATLLDVLGLTLLSFSGFSLLCRQPFCPGEISDFLIIHQSPETSNGRSLDSPREGEHHEDK